MLSMSWATMALFHFEPDPHCWRKDHMWNWCDSSSIRSPMSLPNCYISVWGVHYQSLTLGSWQIARSFQYVLSFKEQRNSLQRANGLESECRLMSAPSKLCTLHQHWHHTRHGQYNTSDMKLQRIYPLRAHNYRIWSIGSSKDVLEILHIIHVF
jgi:hypothetical protein